MKEEERSLLIPGRKVLHERKYLRHSVVTEVSNTASSTGTLPWEEILKTCTTPTKEMITMYGKNVSTNLIVVIIAHYIHVSNNHCVYLKLTQGYMSIISQQGWRKKELLNTSMNIIVHKKYKKYKCHIFIISAEY